MEYSPNMRFGLPLDPELAPYLDERRNYNPNLPTRRSTPAVPKKSAPVTAPTTNIASLETNLSSQNNSKDAKQASQGKKGTTAPSAKAKKTIPKGNFNKRQNADQEKRRLKLQAKKSRLTQAAR